MYTRKVLRRAAVLLDPAVLKKRGVPIARTDQGVGEILIHFPGTTFPPHIQYYSHIIDLR